jgi:MerR family transcriptional regulator, light-induced transcriptional regulator
MPRRTSARGADIEGGLLTIGALSTATGIPIDTIRTWERRYGYPLPERKPSGHRVYPLSTVPRLRRVAQAIARGHRAAEVLPASENALEVLLASLPPALIEGWETDRPSPPPGWLVPADTGEALQWVRAFDAERLKRWFQTDWARLGPLEFLEHRAAAFLRAVGDAWQTKQLEVRHEHFASAVMGDFLRSVRQPLDDRARGPVVALATLPGELHGLGLQMAALVFALAGWRALILGVDTPIEQIAALTREVPIAAVALSCVDPDGTKNGTEVRSLRRKLPGGIPLIVGGSSAPEIPGTVVLPDLAALDEWLRYRRAG